MLPYECTFACTSTVDWLLLIVLTMVGLDGARRAFHPPGEPFTLEIEGHSEGIEGQSEGGTATPTPMLTPIPTATATAMAIHGAQGWCAN